MPAKTLKKINESLDNIEIWRNFAQMLKINNFSSNIFWSTQ
jgi:hypothetical protein